MTNPAESEASFRSPNVYDRRRVCDDMFEGSRQVSVLGEISQWLPRKNWNTKVHECRLSAQSRT